MEHLILMRHAKAEKEAASNEDFDRALAPRGHEQVARIAARLKEGGIVPDLAIVSSALRTRETFLGLSRAFGGIEVEYHDPMFNAPAGVLRRLIEAREEISKCLLVVAHNPGIQQLALDYLTEGAASQEIIDRVRMGYPTATATLFTVDVAGRPTFDALFTAKEEEGA